MKFDFYIFETKAPAWVIEAREEYVAKINPFVKFQIQILKSPSADREDRSVKLSKERDLLFKHLNDKDYLVLFDEKGVAAESSIEFSKLVRRAHESGKARVVFVIGGPFGFDEAVKKRANMVWSLSALTMNHWLSQLVAVEQIYRSFTIIRNLPYHNS